MTQAQDSGTDWDPQNYSLTLDFGQRRTSCRFVGFAGYYGQASTPMFFAMSGPLSHMGKKFAAGTAGPHGHPADGLLKTQNFALGSHESW